MLLRIAYFVNHYPKVSHSFIRREILAMERQGFEIKRLALRGWADALPDRDDQLEQARTAYVLRHGAASLLGPTLTRLLSSPLRFLAALRVAIRMAREARQRPLVYHLMYLAEACVVLRGVRAFGARHVHAHFGTNSAEIVLLMRALGGPSYSFTVHGPDEFLEPMGLAAKVGDAAFAVAISAFGRSQLCLKLPHAEWPKVKVVHCALEQGFYEGAAVPVPDTPRLVCVGRLCEAKGQLLLLEAVAHLIAQGLAVELVLAGDGPMRAAIEDEILRLGIGRHVRITGWISSADVRRELLAARALVLPSFAEGLPVVIMEAMALRRPVLSTYIAGIPELVQPGRTGWLFPAGSLEALTAAIAKCLAATSAELQDFGDRGYERVLERHAIDVETRKLARLVQDAIGSPE